MHSREYSPTHSPLESPHNPTTTIRYAKADANDILVKVIVVNVSDTEETLHVIPQLWFRNTWSFNATEDLTYIAKPHVSAAAGC